MKLVLLLALLFQNSKTSAAVFCPFPGIPAGANATLNDGKSVQADHVFQNGDVLTYSCLAGRRLRQNYTRIYCGSDGHWNAVAPRCGEVMAKDQIRTLPLTSGLNCKHCRVLVVLNSAQVVQRIGFTFKGKGRANSSGPKVAAGWPNPNFCRQMASERPKLTFDCVRAGQRRGQAVFEIQSGAPFTISDVEIWVSRDADCGWAPVPLGASVRSRGPNWTIYVCHVGQLVGNDTAICDPVEQTWNRLPRCVLEKNVNYTIQISVTFAGLLTAVLIGSAVLFCSLRRRKVIDPSTSKTVGFKSVSPGKMDEIHRCIVNAAESENDSVDRVTLRRPAIPPIPVDEILRPVQLQSGRQNRKVAVYGFAGERENQTKRQFK